MALAVFAIIGVPAVLIWWLGFDLAAEPADLVAVIAGIWHMVELVPMPVTVTAEAALSLGLSPTELAFTLSLAPLLLTFGTMVLAFRSGWRFGGRGEPGAWALIGGTLGFASAAAVSGVLAAGFSTGSLVLRIAVPTAVYAIPLLLGFVLRAAREDHEWWNRVLRQLQQWVSRVSPNGAAALPGRAAEVFRLALAGLAALLMLGTLGVAAAIIFGYVNIITLSQGLQLDAFGAVMLFALQLAYLPVAWIWSISWFAGSGFAVGAATSVTPFETLLGPLPALPLFGAIPSGWGWLGGLAPVIVVAIGTVLGGLAGGRPLMRRASALVSAVIPVLAAVVVGLVVALLCVLASGSIGPGRLETNGPGWWQTGGLVALELAFGMSLGVFARRFDVARFRALVPVGGIGAGADPGADAVAGGTLSAGFDFDESETVPLAPLTPTYVPPTYVPPADVPHAVVPHADDSPTLEVEPLDPNYSGAPSNAGEPEAEIRFLPESRQEPPTPSAHQPEPAPAAVPEPTPEPEAETGPIAEVVASDPVPEAPREPEDAVDQLVQAFSWDAEAPDPAAPATPPDWRSRMRSKLGRD